MLYALRIFDFFKQKTAYELRMSDWSSDVCSSDLAQRDDAQTRCRRLRGCSEATRGIDGRTVLGALVSAPVARLRCCRSVTAGRFARRPVFGRLLGCSRLDRNSVVSGKRVSVRVDHVGRRLHKKTKEYKLLR